MGRRTFAGTPTAVAPAGTSRITTALAPTEQPSPRWMPPRILAPAPTNTQSPMTGNSQVLRIPTVTEWMKVAFAPILAAMRTMPYGCGI